MEALELERQHFICADPVKAEAYLFQKAILLYNSGDTLNARATAGRINMYLLDPESQKIADNILLMDSSPDSNFADFWAFLPPIGHFMAGEYGRGVIAFCVDAAALGFGISQIATGCWITGYLCGAITLSKSYFEEAARLMETY